jgi:peroxiredoxin
MQTEGDAAASSYRGNRSLADSHINRSGLSKGTSAPAFRLPLIAGGETTLDSFRGQRLMLVFSDPECRPCYDLMPRLDALHKRTPDIQLLLITRGNIESIKNEFAARPVSFLVAAQRSWEISRRYGIFATPIAYLIGEEGFIENEVAIGSKAILTLLAGAQILSLLNAVPD